ncbi:hypothetical protein [Candidatus Microthrix parvicella]|uniref:hypothetical protein n=1 Tax=Candidatus Neomicrothrix parvicella TaxID=41950 RepID=UPI00036D1A28|nr:hypothetical protein [Candidatus Microthrix parvicella]
MALKTAWTAPLADDRPGERDGGDPLGLRSYANRLARQLVPGLTQATFQTRGFSMLCLGAHLAAATKTEAEAQRTFQHLERLWVAASVYHHGDEAGVAGKRRAKRLLMGAGVTGEYPLDRPLLARPFPAGTLATYRRAAAAFGLVKGATGRRTRLLDVRLTSEGKDLAAAFRSAAFAGTRAGHWARQDSVSSHRVLAAIGADPQPSRAEIEALSAGMEAYDGFHDRPISRLRSEYDRNNGVLDLDAIDAASLTAAQAGALEQARALVDAIDQLEFPLRQWVTTGGPPEIQQTVLALPIWELGAHEPEISRLYRRLLSAADGLDAAVLQFHQERARMRGATAWEPGSELPTANQYVLPDFTLGSLSALFDEGVSPRVNR